MIGDECRKALFPISLSNQDFSTDIVLPLLPNLFDRYDHVTFLVADHLQIYNKALRLTEGLVLKEIIEGFSGGPHYLEQRSRWIARTIHSLGASIEDERWAVLGVDDLADADCFRIFRNVMLAYYAVPAFRHDIDAAASAHAEVRQDKYPLEQRRLLSRGYLLEEIAVSVRIHIVGGVRDEYYLGTQTTPVLGLYDGRYGFTAFDLAERSDDGVPNRFFGLSEAPEGDSWALNGESEHALNRLMA